MERGGVEATAKRDFNQGRCGCRRFVVAQADSDWEIRIPLRFHSFAPTETSDTRKETRDEPFDMVLGGRTAAERSTRERKGTTLEEEEVMVHVESSRIDIINFLGHHNKSI
jgi:hypothetical protein